MVEGAFYKADMNFIEVEDLINCYGEETVDKLSIRRVWDNDLRSYIADESLEAKRFNQALAIKNAKVYLESLLASKFTDHNLIYTNEFPLLKVLHCKVAMAFLKDLAGCREDLEEIDQQVSKGICNNRLCLTPRGGFSLVRKACMDSDKITGGRR